MPQYWFSRTPIFPYKGRIYDTGQREPISGIFYVVLSFDFRLNISVIFPKVKEV